MKFLNIPLGFVLIFAILFFASDAEAANDNKIRTNAGGMKLLTEKNIESVTQIQTKRTGFLWLKKEKVSKKVSVEKAVNIINDAIKKSNIKSKYGWDKKTAQIEVIKKGNRYIIKRTDVIGTQKRGSTVLYEFVLNSANTSKPASSVSPPEPPEIDTEYTVKWNIYIYFISPKATDYCDVKSVTKPSGSGTLVDSFSTSNSSLDIKYAFNRYGTYRVEAFPVSNHGRVNWNGTATGFNVIVPNKYVGQTMSVPTEYCKVEVEHNLSGGGAIYKDEKRNGDKGSK